MAKEEKLFTIKEASAMSGLPSSTLRFYESIGLIEPVTRLSSGHRAYTQLDVNLLDGIACLSSIGMAIPEMREYLNQGAKGMRGAAKVIALLKQQQDSLKEDEQRIQLRQQYVQSKIAYWKAIEAGDDKKANSAAEKARLVSTTLKAI